MPKLFVIGFCATLGGYGLIAGLEMMKARIHRGAGDGGTVVLSEEATPTVPVIGSGLAIGAFLAVSTNLRYQVRYYFYFILFFSSSRVASKAGAGLIEGGA